MKSDYKVFEMYSKYGDLLNRDFPVKLVGSEEIFYSDLYPTLDTSLHSPNIYINYYRLGETPSRTPIDRVCIIRYDPNIHSEFTVVKRIMCDSKIVGSLRTVKNVLSGRFQFKLELDDLIRIDIEFKSSMKHHIYRINIEKEIKDVIKQWDDFLLKFNITPQFYKCNVDCFERYYDFERYYE